MTPAHIVAHIQQRVAGGVLPLGHIRAGAEGAALTGEDDAEHLGVFFQRAEQRDQLVLHGVVHGVHHLGTVERHDHIFLFLLHQKGGKAFISRHCISSIFIVLRR